MDYYHYSGFGGLVDIETEMNLKGRRVLVLGMGETGLSIAKWLTREHARVRVADSRTNPPNDTEIEELHPGVEIFKGVFNDKVFEDVELIAMSPGIPVTELPIQKAVARGVPVVGDIALFRKALEKSAASSPKIIAITGTNGKTTVTAMVGAMLQKSGFDVEVAGNIGPAVLDALMHRLDSGKLPQIWVLEVSSFQLEITESLNADASTVLNLSEDHLDRYANMHDYASAKARVFRHDKPDMGVQILNRDDAESMAMAIAGKRYVTFGLSEPQTATDFGIVREQRDVWLVEGQKRLMKADELNVTGLHNVANALAALALCRTLHVPAKSLLSALREFNGLPHRMEKVAVIDSVMFINDSKSTNVGATVAALKGLQQKVVLIAGGDGKGQDFSVLRDVLAEHVRAIVLIGRDAGKMAEHIEGCGVQMQFANTMSEAVQKSFLLVQKNDAVLLSPACASFDMFRNYIHRAEMFVEAVKDIEVKLFHSGEKKH